jgi:ribokinase
MVAFIGKFGNDIFGKQALEHLTDEKIATHKALFDNDCASGVALITVNGTGENAIVVAPGSNNRLSIEDLKGCEDLIDESEYILTQLEIPLDVVTWLAKTASGKGKKVILNPAPASELPAELLEHVYLITPNETEARQLTGIKVTDTESAKQAAAILVNRGVKIVVITLGSQGAFYYANGKCGQIPAPKVTAIDTTAAGDTFNGALVVSLANGLSLETSIRFACEAASISVTRMGAQTSIPFKNEITSIL